MNFLIQVVLTFCIVTSCSFKAMEQGCNLEHGLKNLTLESKLTIVAQDGEIEVPISIASIIKKHGMVKVPCSLEAIMQLFEFMDKHSDAFNRYFKSSKGLQDFYTLFADVDIEVARRLISPALGVTLQQLGLIKDLKPLFRQALRGKSIVDLIFSNDLRDIRSCIKDYVCKNNTELEKLRIHLAKKCSIKKVGYLEGHTDWTRTLVFSPNGKHLASGSHDQTIRIWNIATRQSSELKGHNGSVFSLAFSPDGRLLASGSSDKSIKLWDVETGKCIKTLPGHTYPVDALTFLPDGKSVVSGSWNVVSLWDIETDKCAQMFKGHEDLVVSVVVSPDGEYLLSGSHDQTVRLWNIATGECVQTLKNHEQSIEAVCFSHDGKYSASCSRDGTVKIYDVLTMPDCVKPIVTIPAQHEHTGVAQPRPVAVFSIAFSRDGKYIASGNERGHIKVHDAATGTFIAELYEFLSDGITLVTFCPDGKYLASLSYERSAITLWDTSELQEAADFIDNASLREVPLLQALSAAIDQEKYELSEQQQKIYENFAMSSQIKKSLNKLAYYPFSIQSFFKKLSISKLFISGRN